MFAEQLIRLGQAFMQGVESKTTLLRIVADSEDEKTKNYWQHVVLVEIDPTLERVKVHHVQSWGAFQIPEKQGRKKSKPVFEPDYRVILAPVFFPTGGNPLHAQGFYGLPIYLMWEKHWRNCAESPKGVEGFLQSRLAKTANIELSNNIVEQLYQNVHERIKNHQTDTKPLGVMILAVADESSSFEWSGTSNLGNQIGSSHLYPQKFLSTNVDIMLERVWEAKVREGAEKGEFEDGVCAFTGKRGYVISGDNKAWGWFTTTWKAPFPESFDDADHVRRLAFSPESYTQLTVGANLFNKLTKQIDFNLNKQLFAPVDSAGGRENASRGQVKSTVFGSTIVMPLLDSVYLSDDEKKDFSGGLQNRLQDKGKKGAGLFLSNLLGYEDELPQSLLSDYFRMTSVYFSGDPSRADIHLLALIEDVVPSVLKKVNNILDEVSGWSRHFYTDAQSWLHEQMKSLPYLLVLAYGPSSLWQNLSNVLHSDSLPWLPFVRGTSHRCEELSHNLSGNYLKLRNEAVFYATFRHFYDFYHETFNLERKVTMRPWQDLVDNISRANIQDIHFDDIEELGFSAGYLVRHFSRQYWAATGGKKGQKEDSKSGRGKDYLQDRVMTFGSNLTPDVIYHKALGRMPEYAVRVGAHLSKEFEPRLGVLLSAYPEKKIEIKKRSDEFMTAFWAGYMLGKVNDEKQHSV